MNFDLTNLIALAVPALFAITLHEYAHGFVAYKFGDSTARMLGRLTLNPIRHIDPVGTIAVPLGLYLLSVMMGTSPLLFGWAKPVPVNGANLRDPVKNMRWIAAAGPASNFVMALLWALFAKVVFLSFGSEPPRFLLSMASFGVMFNVMLMVLNLVPILPLDGGRIVLSLLPWRQAQKYASLERYGLMILLFLMFSGALWWIMDPVISATFRLIRALSGL